jgi:hypothetical protein
MPLWAGQAVGFVRRVEPAGAIVAHLLAEARAALGRVQPRPEPVGIE